MLNFILNLLLIIGKESPHYFEVNDIIWIDK